MSDAPHPSTSGLIGIDWGTSSLRAYRFNGDGQVTQTRHRDWGIQHLPAGGFEQALETITQDWPTWPILACGMLGSRGGWREVPYLNVPINSQVVSTALHPLTTATGKTIHIISGLRDSSGPDMMRGEETQLIGVLASQPSLGNGSIFILPGTHSKWVQVHRDAIQTFHTFMTGELFTLLQRGSTLATPPTETTDWQIFARGVMMAQNSGSGAACSYLFAVRALMLDGQLKPESTSAYLSGLLIGEEFRAASAMGFTSRQMPLTLAGDPSLCEYYRHAAACFGFELDPPMTDATAHGLWRIAVQAGLVTTTHKDLA